VTYLLPLTIALVPIAVIAMFKFFSIRTALKDAPPETRAEILLAMSKVFRQWKVPSIVVRFGRRSTP